jgi:uracil-DNA glycosylase
MIEELSRIWKEIENCPRSDCPLHPPRPLLLKPGRSVNVMVITEGPNRPLEPGAIASLANHPTFTLLQAMFQGKFKPRSEQATAYWTHVRKCFLRDSQRNVSEEDKQKASRICEEYLEGELKALRPRLVVAVGDHARKFFGRYDSELKRSGLLEVFRSCNPKPMDVDKFSFELIILPHPSGRNAWWGDKLIEKDPDAPKRLEDLSNRILSALES